MKRFFPFLLLMLVVGLLYGHTLQVPFYLDDIGAICENKTVQNLPKALFSTLDKRGLSTLTFSLNYHFGGEHVVGYHLVNIFIHLVASCLVLLLLRRVFPLQPPLQLFGALLFAAHPLQTQGVTYLVQRMTSLSALFFLLAVYLFVLARERLAAGVTFRDPDHLLCYGGALLTGGLAILAKENAVVLPLALLLFIRLFSPRDDSMRWRPLLFYLAPFLVLPVLAVVGYVLVPVLSGPTFDTLGHSRHLRSMAGNSPLHYLATQCSVLWIYIRMLFLPYGQALDHAYPISRDLLTFKSVAGGLGIVGLIILAWQLRRRQPAIAGGILWFFLTLAIESSVIPLDPLFEHRLYLPMFGFAILLPAFCFLLPRQSWQFSLIVACLLVLSVLTWRRNALWNDKIAFYTDNLRISPDNERVHFNLGLEYLNAGFAGEGEQLIRESIALNPGRHFGYMALKELYSQQDRLDEAVGMLQYGLARVDADHKGELYNALAFIYGKRGEFGLAIETLERCIEADPNVPAAYYNLAQMLMFADKPEEVEVQLLKALEIDPGYTDARLMLKNLRKWGGMESSRLGPGPSP